jgi:hypothetical protein
MDNVQNCAGYIADDSSCDSFNNKIFFPNIIHRPVFYLKHRTLFIVLSFI